MITIDSLREYGANVDEGLTRCMNNEAFYLKLVAKVLNDTAFDSLRKAVEAGDKEEAFEAAHRLKGAVGNLALTPISEPVNEMVELLRNKSDADYMGYLERIEERKKQLEGMK